MHRSVTLVTQAQLARIVPRIVCGRVNLYNAFKKFPFGFISSAPPVADIFTANPLMGLRCSPDSGRCIECSREGAEIRDAIGRLAVKASHECFSNAKTHARSAMHAGCVAFIVFSTLPLSRLQRQTGHTDSTSVFLTTEQG